MVAENAAKENRSEIWLSIALLDRSHKFGFASYAVLDQTDNAAATTHRLHSGGPSE
jgi:hypothetical protein